MRRTRASLTAVAAVAAVVLAACGTADTTGGGGASGGGAAAGSEEAARNGTADGAARGGTLNILGTSDVDFLDPQVTYYSAGYSVIRLLNRQFFDFPADPAKKDTAQPDLAEAASDHGERRRQRGRQDLHDHHQAGRAVEHQPAAPGDGGGCGDRRQAQLQPGPAVRRPAGLPGPHRGLQAVLRRVRRRGPGRAVDQEVHRGDAAAGRRREGRPDGRVHAELARHVLHRHARAAVAVARPGREPQLRAGQHRARQEPDRRTGRTRSTRTSRRSASRCRATRRGRRRPTRSAARSSTRSSSTRRRARSRSSSSCRPARPTPT